MYSRPLRTTQRKGDLAVARAILTFTALGTDVLLPLTESAAYDLVVDTGKGLYRVQVRYSSDKEVGLRRIHSNSKGYVVKIPQPNAYDWLYVFHRDGREFLITRNLGNQRSITPQGHDLLEVVFPAFVASI